MYEWIVTVNSTEGLKSFQIYISFSSKKKKKIRIIIFIHQTVIARYLQNILWPVKLSRNIERTIN